MKASQIGITVWAIIDFIWLMSEGLAGMYVLPTDRAMYTFVKNRIDPILRLVDYYKKNYARHRSDAKGSEMKTLFNRRIKFCGSNSVINFYEFPANFYIVDECKLCVQENIEILEDRLGRQKRKISRKIGNPGAENHDIHTDYLSSNQQEWLIKCDHCNQWQPLDYYANVVRQVSRRRFVLRDRNVQNKINQLAKHEGLEMAAKIISDNFRHEEKDARVYCSNIKCQKPINRHAPGEYVAKKLNRTVSGYSLNKVFGDPHQGAITELYRYQVESLYDPHKRALFANNRLGVPHSEAGNKITDQMLAECAKDYIMPRKIPAQIFQRDIAWTSAGVDVGGVLHVHISAVWLEAYNIIRCKVFIGQVDSYEALHQLCLRYNIRAGVIDALPDQHATRSFVKAHPGWFMCYYNKTNVKVDHVRNDKKRELQLNRTEAMDGAMGDYDAGRVILPKEWRTLDGSAFLEQMTMPVRLLDDKTGLAYWSKGVDHHRHTDVYDYWAARMPAVGTWAGLRV